MLENARCPHCHAYALLPAIADDGYPEALCMLCGRRHETEAGRVAREDAAVVAALSQSLLKSTGYLRKQHVKVLLRLHQEERPLCYDEVAKLTRLTETSAQQTLTYLARRGLVSQVRASRREKAQYSLTEHGQELWNDLRNS